MTRRLLACLLTGTKLASIRHVRCLSIRGVRTRDIMMIPREHDRPFDLLGGDRFIESLCDRDTALAQ